MSEKYELDCRFLGEFDDKDAVASPPIKKAKGCQNATVRNIAENISREYNMSQLRAEQIVARVLKLSRTDNTDSA